MYPIRDKSKPPVLSLNPAGSNFGQVLIWGLRVRFENLMAFGGRALCLQGTDLPRACRFESPAAQAWRITRCALIRPTCLRGFGAFEVGAHALQQCLQLRAFVLRHAGHSQA